LIDAGVASYPSTIQSFADTAALITNLDVVLSVDTAIAHLSGALGRPTWIMLSQFAVDWRWLLDRDSSPWYPSAKLFRQPTRGDWTSVTDKISRFLKLFKI
jgi:ADP-heptose:LPS heptosyltransferase